MFSSACSRHWGRALYSSFIMGMTQEKNSHEFMKCSNARPLKLAANYSDLP